MLGVLAALGVLLVAPPVVAQDFRQELVFQGNPAAPDLVCPGRRAAASAPPAAPTDMVPPEEVLRDDAINPEYAAIVPPPLPAEVLAGFSLPGAGRALRIGVWGDSHIAAGFVTEEMARVALGKGVESRTTFIPPTLGRPGIRLGLKRVCKGDKWKFEAAYIAPDQVRVGPALSTLRSTAVGSYLWLDMRGTTWAPVKRVDILYAPVRTTAPASAIGVRVDDGGEVRFGLASEAQAFGPAIISLSGVTSLSTIKIRVLRGEFVLHGFRITYEDRPALALDVFGIPSATAKAWSNANVDYLKRAIGEESYDAVILEYGTNEGAVSKFDEARYAAMLTSSLQGMRAVFPSSTCLLIGPTDRGVRIPRRARNKAKIDLLRYSRTHQEITRIQREVGASFKCAVWDWQGYMGGAGAIYRWALRKPPLASSDLIHLTLAGYRQTAIALLNSLGWTSAPNTAAQ